MKKGIIYITFFIFNLNLSFGQVHILIPSKGIEGVPVVVDTTTIADVIKFYGDNYSKQENTLITSYKYETIGLTFQISSYDKNQIIRSIIVEAPFQAKTKNGIILNESTMNDVWSLYNGKGCFTSENNAYHVQNGISFFIKRDIDEQGYNPNEKIYKIDINNNEKYGTTSRKNFEFNRKPIEEKLSELLSILKTDIIDFTELDLFWKKEEKTETKPYGLKKRTNFNRKIENNFSQESIDIMIVGSFYHLNIIKAYENVVYLKFTDGNDSTLFERIDKKWNLSDFDVYVYGTFCSIDGSPPKKCKEMLKLVQENNYQQLAEWVKSINPELATYGYVGLDFLKRKGFELLPSEMKRMKALEKSDIHLNTCQGCIFGVTEKMRDVLDKNNLKQTYINFKQNGWLR